MRPQFRIRCLRKMGCWRVYRPSLLLLGRGGGAFSCKWAQTHSTIGSGFLRFKQAAPASAELDYTSLRFSK